MALNLWSVSAIRWRHLLRFETVLRSCDCGLTCGVPDFRNQSARARAREEIRQLSFSLEKSCRVHMAFAWSSSQKKTRRAFLSLSL